MKFKHLHIENIRSYEKLDLDFTDGVTVISGVNGSGKSSILEACFMAIFGGEVLANTSLKIADMMRKDSSKAVIVLDFEHGGDDYQIEQNYKATKTGAGNSKSVLRKNGEIIAEQTKNTYDAVQKLLNMDEKNFQNCAYIRQGEIDALINAKPKDRQQMIDDLLRLGKLEEYRERAHNSKTAVSRVLRSENERKAELQSRIEQLRSKNLHEELNRRREAVEKLTAAVSLKNEEKTRLSNELTLLESKLKEMENTRKEIENLKTESSDLSRKCDEEISKREKMMDEILTAEKQIAESAAVSEKLRTEINSGLFGASGSSGTPDAPGLSGATGSSGTSGIESVSKINENNENAGAVLKQIKEDENAAREKKHALSGKAEIIAVNKKTLENDILKKENEIAEIQKNISELNSAIETQAEKIAAANASVEGGFSKAGVERTAFLNLFDELFGEIKEELEKEPPADSQAPKESESNEKDCISGVCDISFYSNVVKIEELPLPSDEQAWKTLISDLENLEEYIEQKVRAEEGKITEEERKKASISGESEEKEKNVKAFEKDLLRLEEDKETVLLNLKNENAEFEKKKNLVSDYTALIEMHSAKRLEKIKTVAVLKETVPPSRYSLNDISAEDIRGAQTFIAARKEELISESSGLKSRDTEIQKSAARKEELLKAGKCPTCGQEVTADTVHPAHEAADESRQRTEMADRLKEIEKLKRETDMQAGVLNEISEIDENIRKIQAEMNTFRAEEKGKSEMIEKLRKDLTDIEEQKTALNARKLENSILYEAGRKDLEKIDQRLSGMKAGYARNLEKLRLISEREKEFSNTANSILLAYKTLEGDRKLNEDSQKRLKDSEASKDESKKAADILKADLGTAAAEEIKAKEEEAKAAAVLAGISELREKVENLIGFVTVRDRLKAGLDGKKTTLAAIDEAVDRFKTQISEKEIKARSLLEKISGSDAADTGMTFAEKQKNLADQIRAVSLSIEDLESKKSGVMEQIGQYRGEISVLADCEKSNDVLRNKIQFLAYVSEDVSVLEEMYLRIRSEMRSKNIEALDQLLNEMFEFIYSNNAYSHLELDSDYNLKVHEKDGSVLEPKQLSGGERAIFNLALRCAIYRLLSLGFGENSTGKTSLPPLIFDEPTVFLDSGHVRQLIKLIEHMREDGVGQIIVVSHDESLIDSADVNFKIEKDPLTNASSVV
ncbi:Chromosome partition protein Smc [Methanimicrococcus sp. At1]|uniref:DNA double-strand break repair Rad50 ATPase n=1 Tax=Methanimicrococcus hacksteinii TaxID=3028293 RepID=A0ABU3VNC0_9EURY|nr:AAA family ATPase [Methanimicrococcus sp. At1]MDV0444904.1 Chromosome partition protein Smc [Methanimicrococcus sp. At1]